MDLSAVMLDSAKNIRQNGFTLVVLCKIGTRPWQNYFINIDLDMVHIFENERVSFLLLLFHITTSLLASNTPLVSLMSLTLMKTMVLLMSLTTPTHFLSLSNPSRFLLLCLHFEQR